MTGVVPTRKWFSREVDTAGKLEEAPSRKIPWYDSTSDGTEDLDIPATPSARPCPPRYRSRRPRRLPRQQHLPRLARRTGHLVRRRRLRRPLPQPRPTRRGSLAARSRHRLPVRRGPLRPTGGRCRPRPHRLEVRPRPCVDRPRLRTVPYWASSAPASSPARPNSVCSTPSWTAAASAAGSRHAAGNVPTPPTSWAASGPSTGCSAPRRRCVTPSTSSLLPPLSGCGPTARPRGHNAMAGAVTNRTSWLARSSAGPSPNWSAKTAVPCWPPSTRRMRRRG
jgi:hypothetical protein